MSQKPLLKIQQGFTLLELMIVVAIIGILAAVAIPSYRNHVLAVNRKAAIAEMSEIGQIMERQYNNNNGAYQAYSVAAGEQPEGYTVTVAIGTNSQSYTISAAPNTSQSGDKCGTLTIGSNGSQSAQRGGRSVDGCFR